MAELAEAPSPLSIREAVQQPVLDKLEDSRVEQLPRQSTPQQRVFTLWAKGMGMGAPTFLSRETWQEREHQQQSSSVEHQGFQSRFIELGSDNQQHIIIPQDIRAWEVVPLLRELDELLPPDNRRERNLALQQVGTLLRNSGIYLARRIDASFAQSADNGILQRARVIAETMAQDFFDYGSALVSGEEPPPTDIKEIIQQDSPAPLATHPDQEEAVGRFLLGDSLYEHRMQRANEEGQEEVASQTIRQFFRTVARAEALRQEPLLQNSGGGETVHETFLRQIQERVLDIPQQTVDKASAELTLSFLDQGMQYLRDHMGARNITQIQIKLRRDEVAAGQQEGETDEAYQARIAQNQREITEWEQTAESMREAIGIEGKKRRLAEVRATGDTAAIAKLEKRYAERIQYIISSVPGDPDASELPRDIAESETIQCVGRSILGSTFLSELGIAHLVLDIPEHSSFLVVSSDNTVMLQDMGRDPESNVQITQTMLLSGSQATLNEIITLSRNPSEGSLTFVLDPSISEAVFGHIKSERVIVHAGEAQRQVTEQILGNQALELLKLNRTEEALALCDQAITLNTQTFKSQYIKGLIFLHAHNYNEALTVFNECLGRTFSDDDVYVQIGNALNKLGRPHEALQNYDQAIGLNPASASAYLGKATLFFHEADFGEALKQLRKYKELTKDDKTINKALIRAMLFATHILRATSLVIPTSLQRLILRSLNNN